MRGKHHIPFETIECYLPGILFLFFAIPLALGPGLSYAVAALTLSSISLYASTRVQKRIKAATCREISPEPRHEISPSQVSLNELSGAIAHEINNPLGIIAQESAWIEHLLQTSGLEHSREIQDCRESVQFIVRQVDRCKEIIEKLIHLARRGEPVAQSVDINGIIREMANLVRRDRSGKNIEIGLDLRENLPVILSDGPMLRQVILNLLVNAVQAVGDCGNVSVISRYAHDCIEVSVEDNGCGISPEDLHKVFVPFYSTKDKGESLGLGLALCRGMIEMLGGRITVSSEKGMATKFTIHLPVRETQTGRR
ncbi:MAG: two-component system, NtrC family, sensor kinase [Thermodesulfobacteriota bacterium]|nr:two-component system, NtrC family, sensor kinase [Thermodesulfobacteriota bacterium]